MGKSNGADLERVIKELFGHMLEVSPDEVADQTNPARIPAWDSLRHLILISGFEEEFDIEVAPEEAVAMYTDFRSFKNVIKQKISLRQEAVASND
jgi:acyl carrier protein